MGVPLLMSPSFFDGTLYIKGKPKGTPAVGSISRRRQAKSEVSSHVFWVPLNNCSPFSSTILVKMGVVFKVGPTKWLRCCLLVCLENPKNHGYPQTKADPNPVLFPGKNGKATTENHEVPCGGGVFI